MKYRYLWLFVSVLILFSACKRNALDINVKNIDVNLKIVRFEREFCQTTADSIYSNLKKWENYGFFWYVYSQQILGLGNPNEITFVQRTRDFYDYCRQYHVYEDVEAQFPANDQFLNTSLTDAFKHYKFYFPEDSIPLIFTTITGFNISVYTGEMFIGISLDRYLGKNYPLYPSLGIEKYKRRRMIKQMIPVDVMRAWAINRFPYNDSINNVLTNMIYQGRVQYFLDAMLPDYPDTLKWAYTKLQWQWANKFEDKIWAYLVSQNLLFSQLPLDIKTFTEEAPFTTAFTKHSAPRAGVFIGYKIVKQFLENHPEITLQELMRITDYMYIYNESYYEP